MQQLVDIGLLLPMGDDRFSIHDIIRPLMRAQLASEESAQTRQAARLRLCHWYQQTIEKLAFVILSIVHASSSKSHRQGQTAAVEQALLLGALNWFELEKRGLLTSLEWAYQEDKWEIVLSFADSLSSVLEIHANCKDWEPVLLLAFEASRRSGDRQREAQILNNLGNLSAKQGNWKKAEDQYEQSHKKFKVE